MLIQANCSHTLPLADNSVQCIITSPPYYALRDYNVAGQLGLETTWREWLDNMVAVFMECHRVLRPDGVMWLNIGDKYCNTGGRGRGGGSARVGRTREQRNPVEGKLEPGFKYKDLMGLPWRLAIALQDRGWWQFATKSCKARHQERRTGQYRHLKQMSAQGLCFPDLSNEGEHGIGDFPRD